jgi:hypothetical protein
MPLKGFEKENVCYFYSTAIPAGAYFIEKENPFLLYPNLLKIPASIFDLNLNRVKSFGGALFLIG